MASKQNYLPSWTTVTPVKPVEKKTTVTPILPPMVGSKLVAPVLPPVPVKLATPVAPPVVKKNETPVSLASRVVTVSGVDDYGISHRPADREFGAPLHDLAKLYPEDVYSASGQRIYGTGYPKDDAVAFALAKAARGKPDTMVTIYRAVPAGLKDAKINPGDWVSISPAYARQHGESNLDGKYKIIKQRVRADEIYTSGDSINEWGYQPLPKK